MISVSLTHARTADIPMMVAAAGFDALFVDLEHSTASLETTSMLCNAAIGLGVPALVRVPSHDGELVGQVLKHGAAGVIVPGVGTRPQAEWVVDCCLCPPVGHRAVYGANAASRYQPMPLGELMEHLNRETFVCIMIESEEGVANAEDIASVSGLDMILVGPHDLTADMGIQGEFQHSRFRSAMERIAGICNAQGLAIGVAGIRDKGLLDEFIALGVRFINAGSDAGMLMSALHSEAARIRG